MKLIGKSFQPVILTGLALTLFSSMTTLAASDVDFARIKKDVGVMSKILEGAQQTDPSATKAKRALKVDANYLASQGAVFSIAGPSAAGRFSFQFGDHDMHMQMPSMPPLPDDIDVASRVEIALEGLEGLEDLELLRGSEWLSSLTEFGAGSHLDRESRRAMREIASQMRELGREMSELQIRLIHEDNEADRKAIENEVAELEQRLAEEERKHQALAANLEQQREQLVKKRAAAEQEKLAARQAQMANLEAAVMQSLCDYGSTLKNLPEKEHISIVFDRVDSPPSRQIYVFAKDDVTNCRTNGEDMKRKAVAYLF
jgi:hypothetical protein